MSKCSYTQALFDKALSGYLGLSITMVHSSKSIRAKPHSLLKIGAAHQLTFEMETPNREQKRIKRIIDAMAAKTGASKVDAERDQHRFRREASWRTAFAADVPSLCWGRYRTLKPKLFERSTGFCYPDNNVLADGAHLQQ